MMKLTPLKVTMLMHILSLRSPIPSIEFPSQQDAIAEFIAEDLVNPTSPNVIADCGYKLTERGEAYVRLILSTPKPRLMHKFVDPRTTKEIL